MAGYEYPSAAVLGEVGEIVVHRPAFDPSLFLELTEAKTAGGKTISISTDGGGKVGTATGKVNVTKTDIKAKNGVIHLIDAVNLP